MHVHNIIQSCIYLVLKGPTIGNTTAQPFVFIRYQARAGQTLHKRMPILGF